MNLAAAKRTIILALGTVFLLSLVPASAFASKPYIKAYGGDVFTGGWFRDSSGCNPANNYQDPAYLNSPAYPASNLYGGIQAYAKTSGSNSDGGASVEFAAFALGLIDGARAGDGFYSSGAKAPTDKKLLSFANDDNSHPWGGVFQGTVRQSHCIPDYFNSKQFSPSTTCNLGNFSSLSGQCLFTSASNTVINSGNVELRANQRTTLFVNGDAFIGGNIEYANNYRADTVPKFALVVRGNIYIDAAVTRLDGLYIAQPINAASSAEVASTLSGIIWTCHPNNKLPVLNNFPNTCTNRLVVNGAFIAKQVHLLRVPGDVIAANTGEDSACGDAVAGKQFNGNGNGSVNRECGNIAEVFNYSPEMVIDGPFFNPVENTSLNVQSLVSLPPVF